MYLQSFLTESRFINQPPVQFAGQVEGGGAERAASLGLSEGVRDCEGREMKIKLLMRFMLWAKCWLESTDL